MKTAGGTAAKRWSWQYAVGSSETPVPGTGRPIASSRRGTVRRRTPFARSRSFCWALLLVTTACCLLPAAYCPLPAASAQNRRGRFRFADIPSPRSQYQFRSQLDSGTKIVAERKALDGLAASKKWDEWLRRYQQLLDEHPDGLLPAGEGRLIGLRRTLHEKLRSLPPAVRERYRQQYDGRAGAAFQRAVGQGDPAEVAKVYARFRHTSIGPRALAWLAERALDGGDAERAWLAFSRLVAESSETEPQLALWMVKAVMAGDLAGRPAEVRAMAERLMTQMGDKPLKIAGVEFTAREWVRTRGEGEGVPGAPAPAVGPPSLRGVPGPGRSGAQEAEPEHPNAPTPDGLDFAWPDFAGGTDGTRSMYGAVSIDLRLAWQDVVDGAGMGLPDYYDGGRPRWGTPSRRAGVLRFSHLVFPTLADGYLYAQAPGRIRCVSVSDGKVVWSVREADLIPQRRYPTPGGFRWWRPYRSAQSVTPVAGRLLVARLPAGRYENDSSGWPAEFVMAALDARTGALLWQRGAGSGPPDSFYNLPAVSGQTIYTGIATTMAGLTEYRATALDAATGDRLWTTHLGSGSDPMGGVDGSPAAIRGDTIWIETSLHTVCALDALTGEVQWVATFKPDTRAPERSGWQDNMNVTNEPVSLLALAGDRLLFSPRWSSTMVSLNAKTGHRAWSVETSQARSLAALDGNRALLTGEEIMAIDPATGKSLWTWTPPERSHHGFPALVGSRVVVPVGASVYFLDAATGDERGRQSLKEFGAQPGAGTVLVMGRRLYFAQPDRVLALDDAPDQSLALRFER